MHLLAPLFRAQPPSSSILPLAGPIDLFPASICQIQLSDTAKKKYSIISHFQDRCVIYFKLKFTVFQIFANILVENNGTPPMD
jgi:hypothetical protein